MRRLRPSDSNHKSFSASELAWDSYDRCFGLSFVVAFRTERSQFYTAKTDKRTNQEEDRRESVKAIAFLLPTSAEIKGTDLPSLANVERAAKNWI